MIANPITVSRLRTTATRPLLDSAAESAALIHMRVGRIMEDIASAESKIDRIQNRIGRDRQALLHWQARLSALQNETIQSR